MKKDIDNLIVLASSRESIPFIEQEDVQVSWNNRNNKILNSIDTFHILCSLNLLNSAIKSKEYSSMIHYGGIKNNVSRVLKKIILNEQIKLVDNFWIDTAKNNCVYFETFGVQFSFHSIIIKDEVIEEFVHSKKNIIRDWKGVRMQFIAPELFQLANLKKLNSIYK
jgi:hypothetical protein